MNKVGFFKSIHIKFIVIYVLLILIAMQFIGVYFIRQLEDQLVSNFRDYVYERSRLLAYNVEQELRNNRDQDSSESTPVLNQLLIDFVSEDINEVQVIDSKSKVIGSSNPYNQQIIGKRTTEHSVKTALLFGTESDQIMIDRQTGYRVLVLAIPLKYGDEVLGSLYVVSSLKDVYDQMQEINSILFVGTGITLGITAILSIFLARAITKPMSAMRKQALFLAKGDFSRKVNVYSDDEIGQLAMTFNELTQKLRLAQATTEGERKKLSSVLANMTDGVIATDKNGQIILVNDPAAEILNVTRETLIGSSLLKVLELEEEISLKEIYNNGADYRLLDFSKDDDKPFIIKASFSVIQNEGEEPSGLISVLQDVTEQEKIEQERKEFVANVSHELRTPLTTMKSYIEALTDGAWEDKNIAPRFLHVTQNETERMIRLVNDLLQLSKLDSKDYRLNRKTLNMKNMFHHVIDRFEMSKAQNVKFKRVIPKKNIFVSIDQDKIIQVLDNIISNALKYSPEGGKIVFELEEQDEKVLISVSDEGVGIPEENINKIFNRFYRVDKARTRKLGGTGLGLAIAKEMIEAHGGKIWAESKEGKGTKVIFSLPKDLDCEENK